MDIDTHIILQSTTTTTWTCCKLYTRIRRAPISNTIHTSTLLHTQTEPNRNIKILLRRKTKKKKYEKTEHGYMTYDDKFVGRRRWWCQCLATKIKSKSWKLQNQIWRENKRKSNFQFNYCIMHIRANFCRLNWKRFAKEKSRRRKNTLIKNTYSKQRQQESQQWFEFLQTNHSERMEF